MNIKNYDLGCCKSIKTANYRAQIYVTRINKQFLFNIRLTVLKPYSEKKLSTLLQKQEENFFDAFLDIYQKDPRWLVSPVDAAEEASKMTSVSGLVTRVDMSKTVVTNFGFNLRDLYISNKLEKLLISRNNTEKCCQFITEETLMMLQVIKFLRNYPYTPYLDMQSRKDD